GLAAVPAAVLAVPVPGPVPVAGLARTTRSRKVRRQMSESSQFPSLVRSHCLISITRDGVGTASAGAPIAGAAVVRPVWWPTAYPPIKLLAIAAAAGRQRRGDERRARA